MGDPCIPEQEYEITFSGFTEKEVNVESKSFQCQTRLCLVNHFRGRVSCPYGQDFDGKPPANIPEGERGQNGCFVPGTDETDDAEENAKNRIAPNQPDPLAKCVASQCEERSADNAVYCSCRCANLDGRTDDGAVYCACPEGFACTQLVSSIGGVDEGLTGSYCVKENTQYDTNVASCTPLDPNNNCIQ